MTNSPGKTLYLASASPRRRELLAYLGVRYVVVVSRFDEDTLPRDAAPQEFVRAAAEGKARDVALRRAGIVLGVDTDVFAPDGTILGKPKDPEDARRMLRTLSGKTHTVYSGVCVIDSEGDGVIKRQETRLVETRVTFAPLPDAAIDAYVATGDPMDKAGSYGIQNGGLAFVSHIEGDLSNVIGLPLWTVSEMLSDFGVEVWGG